MMSHTCIFSLTCDHSFWCSSTTRTTSPWNCEKNNFLQTCTLCKSISRAKNILELKWDITLNIPSMVRWASLSLLSSALLCLGLCTACDCESLLGNTGTVVLIGMSSHPCVCVCVCVVVCFLGSDRKTKGYRVLIITAVRWPGGKGISVTCHRVT